jgi:hypothetical protein
VTRQARASARLLASVPPPVGDREPQNVRHGVSAYELLERSGNVGRLDHRNLHAWLLDTGLAERNGALGLLVPTAYGLELGSALVAVE